ncbi:Oidioi.mRNA.OKI2018_I69.PAR.g8538.t1.cds [Oikopleura dioica]|uniref:Oidioi.mRNA.OKI2018_I69.PAR.g8538.t1.cds n=1 Tax=Oikopleura dioica TaxID=34765 RepID=A0ABN7RGG3_OIKDI|nr:Oidioi.mRNA.OKI2018_I69.PAR.g8538.t1.cds [Oikopleura dioica]
MRLITSLALISKFCQSFGYGSFEQRNADNCEKTVSGKNCLSWESQRLDPTVKCGFGRVASAGCANPDNDPRGPWCYTSFATKDNWEYCHQICVRHDVCAQRPQNNLQPTQIPSENDGKCTVTIDGIPCRNWSESVNMSDRPATQRWTTRRQTTATTTRRSPERLAPVRVSSTNNKPICAPMNDDPFYFRDNDGKERRPDVWEQPDEIPGQSRDDRFRSEPRKALRILEGNEATVGQIPWQVQLIGRSACGGTIVAPRIVVTAQHCLENAMDPRRWMVQAGHVQKNSRGSGAQKRAVIKILNTGNYNSPRKHNNDIAIMVTDEPFQFNHLVKPACLPPKNFKPIGGECIISGWGHTSYRGRSSNELLWTLVPLIPRNVCGRQLRERLTGNMICGGGSGPDTCQGDSGGPLVCALRHSSGEKQYTLVGITSFGNGCGNTPGVYTEVADYIDWIHQIISEYP